MYMYCLIIYCIFIFSIQGVTLHAYLWNGLFPLVRFSSPRVRRRVCCRNTVRLDVDGSVCFSAFRMSHGNSKFPISPVYFSCVHARTDTD